jgi:1-acyl-sn-glycerol-3-phosphate acyltransferase
MESKKSKKEIRKFKDGIGFLVRKTQAKVIPIWFDGTDRFFPNWKKRLLSFRFGIAKMDAKIGEPIDFKDIDLSDDEKVAKIVADSLLALADE